VCRDAKATRFVESTGEDGANEVHESAAPYGRDFAPRKCSLRPSNTYFLNAYPDILIRQLRPTQTDFKLKLHEKLDYKRWSENIPGFMGKM
jgi:hypothetical protein